MVALLRGVNVGGRNSLPMADLREIASACGYEDVRTYIQSGNLVLSATGGAKAVARTLEEAIASRTSVASDVVVRTAAELDAIVKGNPFLARGEDPAHLHVLFSAHPIEASGPLSDLDAYRPDEAVVAGRELYLFLPNGLGRSKLAADVTGRKGPRGTVRNWRTVQKLVEMAAATG
jgi:uncharacterized protein (DUF1697 family)